MVIERPPIVTAAVWNWRERLGETRTSAVGSAHLRRAAVCQAAAMLAIAAVLVFLLKHDRVGVVIAAAAVVILLLGLIAPRAYRPIHRFGQWLARGVGLVLVYVLMVPCYYLFFFPVAVLLRWQGRDPLHRRPRAAGLTYWIPRRQETPLDLYERQFTREDKQARELERPVAPIEPATPRGHS
jgi:hypothetical protein